jgi:hypothetical protein
MMPARAEYRCPDWSETVAISVARRWRRRYDSLRRLSACQMAAIAILLWIVIRDHSEWIVGVVR